MTDTDPDPLRTCTRHDCTHRIPHPVKRRPGTYGDYCSKRCTPVWLRDLPTSYTQRPHDTWLCSGQPVAQPTRDNTPPTCGYTVTPEQLASRKALHVEPVAEVEPQAVKVEPVLPKHHQACTDCDEPVHRLHATNGRCPHCVTNYVFAATTEPEFA